MGQTQIPVDIDGQHVVIVDDVLYTGRTIRAALDELADFGRPKRIALAVLIDRGGRELPIQPDIVGKKVSAASSQRVDVLVEELDGRNAVVIADREEDRRVTPSLGKDLLGLEPLSGEQIKLILDTAEPFKEISERAIKKVPDAARRDDRQSVLRGVDANARLVRVRGKAAVGRHGQRRGAPARA